MQKILIHFCWARHCEMKNGVTPLQFPVGLGTHTHPREEGRIGEFRAGLLRDLEGKCDGGAGGREVERRAQDGLTLVRV